MCLCGRGLQDNADLASSCIIPMSELSLVQCSDLETYSPPDYNPNFGSDWLPLVTDPAIREWAKDVNGLWAYLSRIVRLITSVRCNHPCTGMPA